MRKKKPRPIYDMLMQAYLRAVQGDYGPLEIALSQKMFEAYREVRDLSIKCWTEIGGNRVPAEWLERDRFMGARVMRYDELADNQVLMSDIDGQLRRYPLA